MERDKAVYWDEARRWSEEGKIENDDGQGGKRLVLPDADREGLVAVLSSLTKGGRDLSDVPGLVTLLCTFIVDALPTPRPPSPLFDPDLSTHFIRTSSSKPSPHSSALSLITNLQKFSASNIYTSSTLYCLKTVLEIARLREERDLGGGQEAGVLDFLAAVVRFGEVTGGKAAQRSAHTDAGPTSNDEGQEILREVVSVVARIIGCDGLVGVIEVKEGDPMPNPRAPPQTSSILPDMALQIMRDLIRSPANQALKSLRNSLTSPPKTIASDAQESRPPTPVLLLVGTLRSLRKAFAGYSTEAEERVKLDSSSAGGVGPGSSDYKYASLLSLGLPWVWTGLNRVVEWRNERIDAEVLRLVDERIEAAERMGVIRATRDATQAPSSAAGPAAGAIDEVEGGVTYEEWDMAIEILDKLRWHVGAWEAARMKKWTLDEFGELPMHHSKCHSIGS